MPRPRQKKDNRELGMGLLAYLLKDVKPIDPATVPEEKGTYLARSEYLDAFAGRMVKELREMMRAK